LIPRVAHQRKSLHVAITPAALGFRAHSGWAALVAVAGPITSPAVVDRRRIELADPMIPRPVQPYHAAQKLSLQEAAEYIKHSTDEARRWARQALREVIDHLSAGGYEVIACGVPLGSGRPVTTLEATLASHPMLHTAEGELFRGVISSASEHLRLPVLRVKEREMFERGSADLRISIEELQRRIAELGQPIGSPWTQDQKVAALLAWLALRRAERSRQKAVGSRQ
jgi:hypothetical protein